MNHSNESKGAATPQNTRRADKKSVNTTVNPIINFQIGLIAAIVAAFLIIEFSTPIQKVINEPVRKVSLLPDSGKTGPFEIIPNEKPKQIIKKQEPPKKTVVKTDPNKAPIISDDDVPETNDKDVVEPVTMDTTPLKTDSTDKGEFKEPIPTSQPTFMGALTEAPLFPGCNSSMSKEERVDCLNKKMARFIQRNFDTSISNTMEEKDVVKIAVQFTIGTDGLPKDIRVKAPNKELEDEAYKVISDLPKMIPGKINNSAVNVTYALPIRFQVNN
jgi:protein TonB